MTTQPTPGPWIIDDGKLFEGRVRIITDNDSRDLIALVNTGVSGGTADARLIAAAPRMLDEGLIPGVLDALAEAIERVNDNDDLRDIADTLRGHATRQRALLRDIEGEG